MHKREMFALTKGGSTVKHKGKGSNQAPMPDRRMLSGLALPGTNSMNDYAKATPMAQPAPVPEGDFGM